MIPNIFFLKCINTKHAVYLLDFIIFRFLLRIYDAIILIQILK